MNKILLISSYRDSLLPELVETAWNAGWTVAIVSDNMSVENMSRIRKTFAERLVEATTEGVCAMTGNSPDPEKTESTARWMRRHALPAGCAPYTWHEEECALILFTSGSTGAPKGVCHSLGNIQRSARLFVEHFELTGQDRLLCLAPVHTMSGFRSLLLPSVSVNHAPEESSFLSIVQQIDRLKATVVLCGPVFIGQLAAWADRLGSHLTEVRGLLCTGASLHKEIRNRVEQMLGIPVLDYYGLTETAGLVLGDTFSRRCSPGCLPAPCKDVKLELQPTDLGNSIFELAITSPNLFLGYLGSPLKKYTTFNTGDLIEKDGNHCLKLLGRRSGAVKAPSTEWIYPQRLENWLREHLQQVSDITAKTIPVPGGRGLELWVDSKNDVDTVYLDKQIVAQLGKDYQPVRWHFTHIKRTPLGKLSMLRQ